MTFSLCLVFSACSQNNHTKETEEFDKKLMATCKTLNAQCPINVDECTTHLSILLSGKTIMVKTFIDLECEELGYVDYDEFKNKMCQNYRMALEKPFVEFMKRNGYSMVYLIVDENENVRKTINISAQDILNNYK